jgi:hypothetical protein
MKDVHLYALPLIHIQNLIYTCYRIILQIAFSDIRLLNKAFYLYDQLIGKKKSKYSNTLVLLSISCNILSIVIKPYPALNKA